MLVNMTCFRCGRRAFATLHISAMVNGQRLTIAQDPRDNAICSPCMIELAQWAKAGWLSVSEQGARKRYADGNPRAGRMWRSRHISPRRAPPGRRWSTCRYTIIRSGGSEAEDRATRLDEFPQEFSNPIIRRVQTGAISRMTAPFESLLEVSGSMVESVCGQDLELFSTFVVLNASRRMSSSFLSRSKLFIAAVHGATSSSACILSG